jgi:hypothetical protein
MSHSDALIAALTCDLTLSSPHLPLVAPSTSASFGRLGFPRLSASAFSGPSQFIDVFHFFVLPTVAPGYDVSISIMTICHHDLERILSGGITHVVFGILRWRRQMFEMIRYQSALIHI